MVSNRTSFLLVNVCALLTGVTVIAAVGQRMAGQNENVNFGKAPAQTERVQEILKKRSERVEQIKARREEKKHD